MKEDLKLFNTMLGGMVTRRHGNMTKQGIEAYKYTFSRFGKFLSTGRKQRMFKLISFIYAQKTGLGQKIAPREIF